MMTTGYCITLDPVHGERHHHERKWYCGGNTRWSAERYLTFSTAEGALGVLAMCTRDDPRNAARMRVVMESEMNRPAVRGTVAR